MNAHLAALGRLIADPEQRMITVRNARARARMAIAMPQPYGAVENASPPTLWRRLVGFARQADDLARHRSGEQASVSGRLQLLRVVTGDPWRRGGAL